MHSRLRCISAFVAVAVIPILSPPAAAQSVPTGRIVPTNHAVLTGYGTVGYGVMTQGDNANAFTTGISPIFLFQFQDRVLFETELEFEVTDEGTETGLEYAQLDLLLHDNVTVVGGKFLLPFGIFGPRLHPTWINKFPTHPPIYGHDEVVFGADPLMPILSDVGFMVRGTVTPGPANISLNAYVTQGPAQEEGATELELHFPAASSDNNKNKAMGGRLDLALPPWGEVNVSVLNGDYDEQYSLDLTAYNVAAEARYANFEFRGEYLRTSAQTGGPTTFPTLVRDGFYTQLSYRWRTWEPVVRWTQVFDTKLDGAVEDEGATQAGFGLDYWFSPSIALMAGYELNREKGTEIDNDRLVAHIAFGF